jgi:hypothetical protein
MPGREPAQRLRAQTRGWSFWLEPKLRRLPLVQPGGYEMCDECQAVKRRPGGQPGNSNALKHGFYARHFKPHDFQDLESALRAGIQDEVAMLRVATRRLLALVEQDQDPEKAANALNVLGLAAIRIANLLKTQKMLYGETDSTAQAISTALAEIVKEMGLKV